jgi:aryl-alcohol dehydrogenase-like predicted oxidoreductase
MGIPLRRLGRTGVDVTILGLGGEGILRTVGYDREASAMISRALDLGITYCESARAYAGSEYYYGKVLGERRGEIFLASKSHARDRKGALRHLEETLSTMRTDYLDLWQVHDVRSTNEIEAIFGPAGALEAFLEARQKGLVRFLGITGHHDPSIIRQCIEMFDFDTVLMPVNPGEPHYRSFLDEVLPVAQARDMGVIAMKVYFRGLASRIPGFAGMEPYFRFALSQPVTTAVIGCDDLGQLEENVNFARSFHPMSEDEMQEFIFHHADLASRLMYYKP